MTYEFPGSSPLDEALDVLRTARTWAVVGASDDPYRASNDVMQLLLDHRYDVVPVNPNHDEVLGRECYPSLADVPVPVDVVDLFRRSEEAGVHVNEAVTIGARVVWCQLDVWPDPTALDRARTAGLTVILNRCPAQDLPQLGVS